MGSRTKRAGTRLPTEASHGISTRDLHPVMGSASGVSKTCSRFGQRKIKKTGLVSQGVTEKPGEFSK